MGNFLAFSSADGVSIRVFLVFPKPSLVPGSTQVKKYCNNNGAALLFYNDKMDVVEKVGATVTPIEQNTTALLLQKDIYLNLTVSLIYYRSWISFLLQ